MNIFYLSDHPHLCAEFHCDKHISKMIVETAQMLSTAHHELDGEEAIEAYIDQHIKIIRLMYGLEKIMVTTIIHGHSYTIY